MIDLHDVSLDDKPWIDNILKKEPFLTCEYSFGNIFSYSAKMNVQVGEYDNCLITKCTQNGTNMYCCPIGGDIRSGIEFILNDDKKDDKQLNIFGISPNSAEIIAKNFSNELDIFLDRDSFDYIYLSDDLINLKGKKYQPKRNHISFFMRNNNWSYEKLSKDSIPECLEMSKAWLETSNEEYRDDLLFELKIIEKVFQNYDELSYVGGVLRTDGKVVAYTMGEEMTDNMFCVHIEKAFSDIRGAYPMINQQFVKNELSSYKYINREDDTGAENLRKAKLSYHPAILANKYGAKLKNVY